MARLNTKILALSVLLICACSPVKFDAIPIQAEQSSVTSTNVVLPLKTPATYVWQSESWGACAAACGPSSQTRLVKCARSDGTHVFESLCPMDKKPEEHQGCPSTVTCNYSWKESGFGSCSKSCGTGTKTQSVNCQRSDGTIVADDFCAGTSKPPVDEPCSSFVSCDYVWQVGSWGGCAAACGPSSQTRTVTCARSDGTTVLDVLCPMDHKPDTHQSCPSLANCTYSWTQNAWSSCSVTCGPGTKTATNTCVRTDGFLVADSFCAGQTPPATSQTCSPTQGCTYTWIALGDWNTCSNSCGTGTQSQTIKCQRSDGTIVDNASCPVNQKPDSLRSCPNTLPCELPAWTSGAWNACTNSCGSGTHTRTIQCQKKDGTIVDSASCSAIPAPDTSQTCENFDGCSFKWQQSSWSTCAQACGVSHQTASVACYRSDGAQVGDLLCNSAGPKPPVTQACPDFSLCTYDWQYSPWGACSKSCGEGTKSHTAICTRSFDQSPVANSFCATPPILTDRCMVTACVFNAWCYHPATGAPPFLTIAAPGAFGVPGCGNGDICGPTCGFYAPGTTTTWPYTPNVVPGTITCLSSPSALSAADCVNAAQ